MKQPSKLLPVQRQEGQQRHWHRSEVFIVTFDYPSHLFLLFLLLTLNM